MTDEQMRVSIAEACGWKPYTGDKSIFIDSVRFQPLWEKEGQKTPEGWFAHLTCELPDYLNDLNSMHEAERVLRENPHWEYQYGDKLREITGNVGPRGGHFAPNGFGCFALAHATSRQRAEAFLKTIGKWDDKV